MKKDSRTEHGGRARIESSREKKTLFLLSTLSSLPSVRVFPLPLSSLSISSLLPLSVSLVCLGVYVISWP